jgi:PglZ domain
MSLRPHIQKRLLEVLEQRRVVVWYDGEKAFTEMASSFAAPACSVVLAHESRLRARRAADEMVSRLNEVSFPDQKNRKVLIYAPWPRGASEEERLNDAFESFALIGAAFGDKEAESFQSLARQALPERIAEIDRLFAEGRPTVAMIEGLGEGIHYPILREAIGTESAIEAAALLLCRDGTSAKIDRVAGARDELLRLLRTDFGFSSAGAIKSTGAFVEQFGRYALLSEFALDLPENLPGALSVLPIAEAVHRERIFALCDRMRGSDDTREGYSALAHRVESDLRVADITRSLGELGTRYTLPFMERAHLVQLEQTAQMGNLTDAREIIQARRASVWNHLPERALIWKLAERCVDFLTAAAVWKSAVPRSGATVQDWVAAYVTPEGLWQVDRQQRLVEQGAAACAEDSEVAGLVALCRQIYRDVAGSAQTRFLRAVEDASWPPEGIFRQTQIFARYIEPVLTDRRKTVFFLVDSMRYEMGRDLAQTIETFGPVTVGVAATILPTTTPCGMAALMPAADGTYCLVNDGDDLVPAIGGRPLRNSKERMDLLRELYGDRFVDLSLSDLLSANAKRLQARIGAADFVVIRTQEIDGIAEGPSSYLARKVMSEILRDIAIGTGRLVSMGFETFVYAADHGHVLLPEVEPGDVVQDPPGQWRKNRRRCRLGTSTGETPGVTIFPVAKVGIIAPVPDFAVAKGFRVFSFGEGYFHEGLSLQECVIPLIVLEARERPKSGTGAEEVEVRYRSDRFTSRVIGLRVWYNTLIGGPLIVKVEAYDGSGARATIVGEAADCDARDPATHLVALQKGSETQVPIQIRDDFSGSSVEIRVVDPGTGRVLHRLKLKNAVME